MEKKKPSVFAETQGFNKTSDQVDFKLCAFPSQEPQPKLNLNQQNTHAPKSLGVIVCFDCQRQTELCGYRFALVPLCACCRKEREVQITNNRFERRRKK